MDIRYVFIEKIIQIKIGGFRKAIRVGYIEKIIK
jgi:hypothetical protein